MVEPQSGRPVPRELTRQGIRDRIGDPRVFVGNVLPRVAYEDAHIPGSASLPVEEIPSRARETLPDPDQEIAVYCGGPT